MFENTTILEEKKHVSFHYDGTRIYSFRNEELRKTRIEKGNVLSEPIERLLDRNWVTPELLYQLASIIVKKNPDTGVDWQSTFSFIEQKAMMKNLYKMQKTPSKEGENYGLKTQKEVRDELLDYLEFTWSFDYTEVIPKLKKLVSEKLKNYRIIK